MRILIVGSKGNMGSRYVAVCKSLNIEVVECDVNDSRDIYNFPSQFNIDKCIIATPISEHMVWCYWCVENKIPFLCEKPISKDIEEIKAIKEICEKYTVDGRMVCNWIFTFPGVELKRGKKYSQKYPKIFLNYYNTGKDSFWDFVQPVYLSNGNFEFEKTSPIYKCTISGAPINQYNFDFSYLTMILTWICEPTNLWSLDDAIKAHEKLMEWKEKNWHE